MCLKCVIKFAFKFYDRIKPSHLRLQMAQFNIKNVP